jgi:hypothetical protein
MNGQREQRKIQVPSSKIQRMPKTETPMRMEFVDSLELGA